MFFLLQDKNEFTYTIKKNNNDILCNIDHLNRRTISKKWLYNSENKTNSLQVGKASSVLLQLENKYNRNTTPHTVLQCISAEHAISFNCSSNVTMNIKLPSLFPLFYSDRTAYNVSIINGNGITTFLLFFGETRVTTLFKNYSLCRYLIDSPCYLRKLH